MGVGVNGCRILVCELAAIIHNSRCDTGISPFSDMDAEISALETKLAKYKQVKQGMMQNLLTGKI